MNALALALLAFAGPAAAPSLPPEVCARFTIASARHILVPEGLGPQARRVAEALLAYIRGGMPGAFVSEDGKAVGQISGRIEKLGTDPPGLLAHSDTYRMLLHGGTVTPYNVSQRPYLSPDQEHVPSVMAQPLVAIDRYRTLCAHWEGSMMEPYRVPPRSLLLGVIDDRQRGPRPNFGRRIPMQFDTDTAWVEAARGDWYVLGVARPRGAAYLEVDARTLRTRRCRPPVEPRGQTTQAIKRAYPDHEFVGQSQARWCGRTYFVAYFRPKAGGGSPPPAPYVWDGKQLTSTAPWTIVAASLNGRFGWLVNLQTSQSWLITPRK